MEQLHLTFYETPKHGYLRVPGEICRNLNISQSFGPFSYYFFETDEEDPDYYKDIFYLEEDIDYPMFQKRCELDNIKLIVDDVYITSSQENDIILSNHPVGRWYCDRGRFGTLEQNLTGLSKYTGENFDDEIAENV